MSLIAGNLGFVQRLLDDNRLTWGICAGAAAHLYGDRRPIQDIDILVTKGSLTAVVKLLQSAQKAVQFDGQRILWRGIKVFDDLSIKRTGRLYPFTIDEPMIERLRRMPLLGAHALILAPEDILIHKLLLGRGADQGKHDYNDAAAICRRQQLDREYLAQRIQLMNAQSLVETKLQELGVALQAE